MRDSPGRGLACRSQEQAGPARTLGPLAVRMQPKKSQDLANRPELSRSYLKSPSVYARKMGSLGKFARMPALAKGTARGQRTPDMMAGRPHTMRTRRPGEHRHGARPWALAPLPPSTAQLPTALHPLRGGLTSRQGQPP